MKAIQGEEIEVFLVKTVGNSRKHCVRKMFIFSVKPKGMNLFDTGRQSVNLEPCTCEGPSDHSLNKYRVSKPWLSTPPSTGYTNTARCLETALYNLTFYVLIRPFYTNCNLNNFSNIIIQLTVIKSCCTY